MAVQKLLIPTMKCGGCVATVETALNALPNVASVSTELESKTVTIDSDVTVTELISTAVDSGFPAESI